jgi:hypothetical protein
MHRLAFTHEVRGVSETSLREGLIVALRGSGLRLDLSQPGHAQLSEPDLGELNAHCRLLASLSFLHGPDGVRLLCLLKALDVGTHASRGPGHYLAARLQELQTVVEKRLRSLGVDVRSRAGDRARSRRATGPDVIWGSRPWRNSDCRPGLNGRTADEQFMVVISDPVGRHSVPRRDLEAYLALGRFVAGHSSVEGVDQQGLAGCVQALWWTIEAEDESDISLDDAGATMTRFLDRQVRIRDQLPVRQIYRCRDCQFEKVVDPECVRLLRRNRLIMSTAAPSQSATTPEADAFRLGGRLLSIKDLDPDYICPRCQGREADETLATICPECGALSKDPVLSVCPSTECHLDFRRFLAHSRSALVASPVSQP